MPRPSKIDRLPPEIREKIGGLRAEGFTIDEIMIHLAKMAIDPESRPSRSGLHRHIQSIDKIAERLRHHRAVAEALVKTLGDAPENRTARLNIEMMHTIVTDLMSDATEGGEDENGVLKSVTLDPSQVHFLAKSLDHLARAAKGDAELTIRIRKELTTQMERKVKEIEREAEAGPITAAEALARVRAIYAGEA